ncbi:hypothetical protein WICPIJ_001707, partial [Wickerhamomyces pijperi]
DKILNSGLEIDMTDEAAGLYIVTDEKQREAIRKEAEVEQLREEKEKQQDGDDAAGEETSNL